MTNQKPKRLYFKSYIQLVKNSVDSNMFRNFFVQTPDKGQFDALSDGYNSCAFYVSSVLTIFKKLNGIHGTVKSTLEDLNKSGWYKVNEPKPGDILVWEPKKFPEGMVAHIGFYIGDNKAISTSINTRTPIVHAINFGQKNRQITDIFRMDNWEVSDT